MLSPNLSSSAADDSAQYHRKFRAQTSHTPVLKHHLITIPPSAFNLSIEIVQIRPNGDPGLNTNPFLKPVRVFIFFKFLSEIHILNDALAFIFIMSKETDKEPSLADELPLG